MASKQLEQNYKLCMALKTEPKNLKVASRYISAFIENFNFETLTANEHNDFLAKFGLMMIHFRTIRGR